MVFDPRQIKKRKIMPENLPENASREQKIEALANQLHERGLTASVADAKRLAEGMVDVESKVISASKGKEEPTEDRETLRYKLQSGGSMIFDAVLGSKARPLVLDKDFQEFVEKSKHIRTTNTEPQTVFTASREVPETSNKSQITFDEAPPRGVVFPFNTEPVKLPAKETVSDTTVEKSPDGVVLHHTESTPDSTITEDVGIIVDEEESPAVDLAEVFESNPEPEPVQDIPPPEAEVDLAEVFGNVSSKPEPQPESPEPEKKKDLAKEAGIDLTDIFYTGSDR